MMAEMMKSMMSGRIKMMQDKLEMIKNILSEMMEKVKD
jgi:hypothetical protein